MAKINMNNQGNWTLPVILGLAGVILIILSLADQLSKWWTVLGIILLWLAFKANK